jgi:basic membrane lipoprotein Med (substrate-binding protein (PBP1-ABC) superfamily)
VTHLSDADVVAIRRRSHAVIIAGQALAGIGMGATFSAAALLATDLSGSPAWSGTATTLSTLGAAAAAQQSGGKVSVIWVDTDGCVSAAQYCNVFLTSVMKGMEGAVKDATLKAKGGPLTGGYLGTLENNGTALAPFHEFDSKVPADVKTELDQIKTDIASGTIKITSPSQPKAS